MVDERTIRDHATEFLDRSEALKFEDSVWWTTGRRAILERFLERAGSEKSLGILEIGCGSGGDLALLARFGRVWGLERSAELADRARSRNVAVAISEQDAFEHEIDPSIDLVVMLDVLEHIEDDSGLVRRIARQSRSGRWLLISVPAAPFLFGRHDRILHHYRRYARRELEALLRREGFEIFRSSHFFFFLFPLAVIARLFESSARSKDVESGEVNLARVPLPVDRFLAAVLRLESRLNRFVRFPFGLWAVVLARHPGAAGRVEP